MQLAYATLILAGVSFQTPNPVTIEECTALEALHPQTLCIEVLPPCGVGEAELCPDQPKAKVAKKRTVRRQVRR